jgi:hypothetical protein
MASLGELFVELGVFADTKELENFENKLEQVKSKMNDTVKQSAKTVEQQNKHNKSLKDGAMSTRGIIATMTAFVTALVGAGVALNRLTDSLVQSNQKMLDLTRTSDIALSTFQQWDDVGKMFGVDNASQQLDNLNQKLFELRLTGQGARGFQLAGINPIGQDAEGVLEQLRGRIRGMSDTSASYLLQQMGIDPKMLHLLRMSREEFEELQETLARYRLTDEQTHSIQAMNAQLQIARIKLEYLKNRVLLKLMPIVVEFTESIATIAEAFLIMGKTVINTTVKFRGFITGTILLTTNLKKVLLTLRKFPVIFQMFKPIAKFLINTSKMFKNINLGLVKAIAKLPIFGTWIARIGGMFTKWLFPLTTAYLILDDIATYMTGGDSLLGRVMDWMSGQGQGISEAFSQMFGGDVLGGAGDLLTNLSNTLNGLTNAISRLVDILTDLFIGKAGVKALHWINPTGSELIKNFGYDPETGQKLDKTAFITPATNSMINNNNATYDNSNKTNTVNQTIAINTNQPVDSIKQQLQYANRIMA